MRASDFFGALIKVEDGDDDDGEKKGDGVHDQQPRAAAAAVKWVGNHAGVKWVLPAQEGGVNGWGAIAYDLELLSITGKVKSSLHPMTYVKRLWDKRAEEAAVMKSKGRPVRTTPKYPDSSGGKGGAMMSSGGGAPSVRATLLAPAWTLLGWTQESRGFVYWATTHIPTPLGQQQPHPLLQPAEEEGGGGGGGVGSAGSGLKMGRSMSPALQKQYPRLAALPDGAANKVLFGTNLLRAAQDGSMYDMPNSGVVQNLEMVAVHVFAHRYAIKNESTKVKRPP